MAPDRLVFLLEYIGSDYGEAVRDGRVANANEHREVTDLSRLVAEQYAQAGGSEQTAELMRLRELIKKLRPWEEVRALSLTLASRIADEMGTSLRIPTAIDLHAGRLLYLDTCAVCHGPRGGGDGEAAAGMDPPPTSFQKPLMNLIRPRQAHAAIAFGIDATAMPSFGEAFTEQQLWDVTFYVMTLRQGFDPRPADVELPISLEVLAISSNDELLTRLRKVRPGTTASEIDYYRMVPPRPSRLTSSPSAQSGLGASSIPSIPGALSGPGGPSSPMPPSPDEALRMDAGGRPAGSKEPEPSLNIEAATQLENAFAQVAERVFPSVVGLSFYVRDTATPAGRRGGWREPSHAEPRYPGYRLLRAESGFFVSDDGYMLTCYHRLVDPKTRAPAEIIDVEYTNNFHARARVIGVEPTVDLAVLKSEAYVGSVPAPLGDSDLVRVGQWAIALADPPGVEKTFVPGTIAARPERECYQAQRTSTLLQTSLRIGPESFGGPLVNIRGEVIGLTVPGTAGPGLEDAVPGPTLALPIKLAMTLYEALKVKESRRSPWLGVSVLELSAALRETLRSSPVTGVYIDDVFDPSPASRAGVRVGDVLTGIDGHRLVAVQDFQRWLYLLGIGKFVSLDIWRDGEKLHKKVTIEERPAGATSR